MLIGQDMKLEIVSPDRFIHPRESSERPNGHPLRFSKYKHPMVILFTLALATGFIYDGLTVQGFHKPTGEWSTLQGPTPILAAVEFVDADTGWAVGDLGTILHTEDAGATWSSQTAATTTNLDSLVKTRFEEVPAL